MGLVREKVERDVTTEPFLLEEMVKAADDCVVVAKARQLTPGRG